MFKSKTLSSIVASFTKIEADLIAFIESKEDQVADNNGRIAELQASNIANGIEITTASGILNNISKLLNKE